VSRQSTEEAESQRKSVFSLKNFWSCSWVEKPESAVEVVDLVSSMSMAVEQPQIEDCSRIVKETLTRVGQWTATPNRAARSELSQASKVY